MATLTLDMSGSMDNFKLPASNTAAANASAALPATLKIVLSAVSAVAVA